MCFILQESQSATERINAIKTLLKIFNKWLKVGPIKEKDTGKHPDHY